MIVAKDVFLAKGGCRTSLKICFVFSQNSFESGCDYVVVFTQQLLTKYTHYIQHVVFIHSRFVSKELL